MRACVRVVGHVESSVAYSTAPPSSHTEARLAKVRGGAYPRPRCPESYPNILDFTDDFSASSESARSLLYGPHEHSAGAVERFVHFFEMVDFCRTDVDQV